MNSYKKLQQSIKSSGNILCVGLDSDIKKIPSIFSKDLSGLLEFNKTVIEATRDLAAAYKINFAFYEQYGAKGFDALQKTFEMLPQSAFSIADAKRGDIGNTSAAYARSVFNELGADSITVNPYMGLDSLDPFFEFSEKIIFVLALTSNGGSFDFQKMMCDGTELYKHVIDKTYAKYNHQQMGYVVGATHPEEIAEVRALASESILLLPGVGAQGADVSAVMNANQNGLAMINVSRDIIYPQSEGDFAENVWQKALHYSEKMKFIL